MGSLPHRDCSRVVDVRPEELEERIERRRLAVLEADACARGPAVSAAPHPGDATREQERIPERGRHYLESHHRLALHARRARLELGELHAGAAQAEIAHARVVGKASVPTTEGGVEIDAAPGV